MPNPNHPHPIQLIPPTQPQLPDMTQIPTDPTNPLAWLFMITILLTATEKPLNAIANLLHALLPLLKNRKRK